MKNFRFKVGAVLRQRRQAAGLKQIDLSSRISASHQQVCKYETGRNRMHIDTFIKITSALGLDACDVMREIMQDEDVQVPSKRRLFASQLLQDLDAADLEVIQVVARALLARKTP